MSKKEELIEQLKEGISVEKIHPLIEEAQRENILSKAPKSNLCSFEDKRAQLFSDLWFSQRKTATVEQKDKVGLVFISKALDLGDEIAQKFAQGDHGTYRAVGEKQSAIPTNTDLSGFWQKVKEIFPGVYTNEDMSFLIKEGGIDAVLHFVRQIEVTLAEESPILRSLATNAHAYK